MYFKAGQNIKKKNNPFKKPKTFDTAVVMVFSSLQNMKISQIFMPNNSFLLEREQVITYWENDNRYCQGDSHQHSQTTTEANISFHDGRVGLKQFWLNVFYKEKEEKCFLCVVLSD